MRQKFLSLLRKFTKLIAGTGIGKVEPLFKIYSFFLSQLKPKMVVTEGSKMYLDKKDTLLLSIYPNFEPFETKIVKKYVKKGMTVVDAGANIGYYTLLLSRLVGPKGLVHAFEPGKENFELLKKNVELNKYKNTKLNRAALSNKEGAIKLYLSETNPQDHRIVKDKETRKFEKVSAVTLDKYFGKKNNVDFIKMDIQGAEILALEGAKKILSSSKKLKMILEFWPYAIRQTGRMPMALINMLKKNGKIFLIDEKSGKLLPWENTGFDYTSSENSLFNLFFEK